METLVVPPVAIKDWGDMWDNVIKRFVSKKNIGYTLNLSWNIGYTPFLAGSIILGIHRFWLYTVFGSVNHIGYTPNLAIHRFWQFRSYWVYTEFGKNNLVYTCFVMKNKIRYTLFLSKIIGIPLFWLLRSYSVYTAFGSEYLVYTIFGIKNIILGYYIKHRLGNGN